MHVLYVNARYTPEGIAGPAFTTQFLAEQLVREGDRATSGLGCSRRSWTA